MKQLLLVLTSSMALSCWAQTGVDSPKTAMGTSAMSGQSVTILVQPGDQPHQLPLPNSLDELQSRLGGMESLAGELETIKGTQAGCPVQIVGASFERVGQLMLISQSRADSAPTLHLGYMNSSGKNIESVILTGWIKVKVSPYHLDSVTRAFALELSREALLGKDMQATSTLKLAANAIGMDKIELSQVNYADGTTWKPERRSCVYPFAGNLERANAW